MTLRRPAHEAQLDGEPDNGAQRQPTEELSGPSGQPTAMRNRDQLSDSNIGQGGRRGLEGSTRQTGHLRLVRRKTPAWRPVLAARNG
jgi:hypothetical protein